MIHTTGNHGDSIRSDCLVSLELLSSGGIQINLNSKVKALYGDSILRLFQSILRFYGIRNAYLGVEDSGALPFTLAARLEAAIKLHISSEEEYLLPILPQNQVVTPADRDRITRLYLPGNNPKLMINAGIYGSDGIILDLEDSVSPAKKHEARILVRNALRSVDFYGAERMVRINQIPLGLDDLKYCIPHGVNLILIPKCESSAEVRQANDKISELLGTDNTSVHLMPIIESASGLTHANEIANATETVVALAIGLEDYTADIGVQRTKEGNESRYARNIVVNAAVAAGKQPIDSVFSDIDDMDALARQAIESRSMGFQGMGCIHPRQIQVIHENFLPGDAEIEKAEKITAAFQKANSEGSAVVTLDSKMIDPPVVKRALKTLERARQGNKVQNRKKNEQ